MDYIKWIRSKVGTEMIILNFAGAIVLNEEGQILLQRRRDKNAWGFPGGAME
ncbi:8-oxo-dGTP pyrophosphatase MutT (NUDIX family) [Paenibacillus tundrae]|nr:8-oxo-dGTP pyrophosphatase MutT (NUDIX family) [Paenibacillus tundrae]